VEHDELVQFDADNLAILILPGMEPITSGWEEVECGIESRLDQVRRGVHMQTRVRGDYLERDRRWRRAVAPDAIDVVLTGVTSPWIGGQREALRLRLQVDRDYSACPLEPQRRAGSRHLGK